ncbi:hypothetical protein QBC44DRAFT_397114 [Cladorrhinum sp. PSN332]|nr:hypothetical protein QBC44DRAFT_397114 [Cladorrhinum sp. PSN332]
MPGRVFLQQLYPESDKSAQKPSNVDIVLIHGVNGDPVKTWECKNEAKDEDKNLGDTVLWPQHFLPRRFPGARVLTYGYNGDMYHNDSISGIRDLAKSLLSCIDIKRQDVDPRRPIIFIAHCLGGLIVKQALHTAHYERDYNYIADRTAGIFFFGTPHVAAAKDKWDHVAKAYSALDKPTGWLKRSRLVKALQKDSDELMDMMDKFRHMLTVKDQSGNPISQRWAIGNFYETLKMPGAKAVIVDATAAQLDALDGEIQRQVDADHVGMCRFSTVDSQTFQELCLQIKELVPKEAAHPSTQVIPRERPAPGVNVEFETMDNSGRTLRINGRFTPLTVTRGSESVSEENVRQGYYLEDQRPSPRALIEGSETTRLPMTAASSAVRA